jgi:hypothetical protein
MLGINKKKIVKPWLKLSPLFERLQLSRDEQRDTRNVLFKLVTSETKRNTSNLVSSRMVSALFLGDGHKTFERLSYSWKNNIKRDPDDIGRRMRSGSNWLTTAPTGAPLWWL